MKRSELKKIIREEMEMLNSINEYKEVDIYSEIENELNTIYSKLNNLEKKTDDVTWKKAIQSIINGFRTVDNKMSKYNTKLGIVRIK